VNSTMTRRRLIGTGAGAGVAVTAAPLTTLLSGCGNNGNHGTGDSTDATPKGHGAAPSTGTDALHELIAGNERFVQGRLLHPRQSSQRRAELAEKQEPFAVILGCADSRVPPEVLFDQGLGDLFAVRVAGNTAAEPIVLGSIEYAVEHLGSVLVMVLGHASCGAVKAAIAAVTEGADEPGSIGDVVAPIVPVVKDVSGKSPDLSEKDLLSRSIRANVERTVEELQRVELLSHLIEAGKLKIVGAEYEFDSGRVKLV
jgi:carbonic anhydrase